MLISGRGRWASCALASAPVFDFLRLTEDDERVHVARARLAALAGPGRDVVVRVVDQDGVRSTVERPGVSAAGGPADTGPAPPCDEEGARHVVRRHRWGRRLVERWVPVGLRTGRWDPGRRGVLALGAVALVTAGAALITTLHGRPTPEPVPVIPAAAPSTIASSGPGDESASDAAAPRELVVSVVGQVARPGLVTLPDGARVADALEAAGGALPGADLTTLNLARRLSDGEQVPVGVPPPLDATTGDGISGGGAGGTPQGKVNLNSAGVQQLDALPGIGPVTARRIVEWRARNGRFRSVEQLREIEGIGEGRLARLRELVTL